MVEQINFGLLNSATPTKATQSLYKSLQSTGFARIAGHDVSPELISAAHDVTRRLFALSTDTKSQYQLASLGERGYTGFGLEKAVGYEFPDLKEFWHIGPELVAGDRYYDFYPKNLWPKELLEFRAISLELYSALSELANSLLAALGQVMQIESDYFAKLTDQGNSVLRLIHYPAQTKPAPTGQLRAAAHADVNLLTLLVGASDSGLELQARNGDWIPVENKENEIVVDTGEMMSLITAGDLPATIHRVSNPQDMSKPRYSMPFFVHPHGKASLEPHPRFVNGNQTTPITADEFLKQRLQENGLAS